VVRNGVSIYDNDTNDTAVAVNPTASGVQILTSIGGPDSPLRYAFPFEGVEDIQVASDGGATLYDGHGNQVASVAAPWATDAAGDPVPTHYEVSGDTLIQVVEHTDPGVEYPVLADPNVFMCDAWTHICVKFTKSETKTVASWTEPGIAGAAAFANELCGKITVGLPKAACAAFVSVYAVLLSKSFSSAASNGKCVELHFPGIAGPFWWKTEGC
jgi:hypothetical protein